MNREIKFRAYDLTLNMGMCEVVGIDLRPPHNLVTVWIPEYLEKERGLTCIIREDNAPLMQYTGLKDKNGKEIYEGDIVKIEDSADGGIETVEYEDGGFYPFCISGSECNDSPGDAEIIGNVYENPELLK